MKKVHQYRLSADEPSTLEEPMVVYGHHDMVSLASRNISKDYIKDVQRITKLSVNELIDLLPISIDTYKRKTQFNPNVTEKILEIQEVYQKGLDAFGEDFYLWMDAPNVALGGSIPKALLSNSFGIRRLLDQIGRMEHGVFA